MLAENTSTLSIDELEMLAYMLGSGTYGNSENFALHAVQADMAEHGRVGGRIRYFARRLFPPTDTLKHTYPILQRAPWLRPAVDLYRFTIRPFQQRAKLRTELSAVMGKAGENAPGTNK